MRPFHLAVVLVGGTLGTAVREALLLTFPPEGGFPFVIFGINIAGALLLGVLLEALVRRGADQGRRRIARLLVGTGFLGGFSTYSALAVDGARLIEGGSVGTGIGYGLVTVVIGALATWLGVAIGGALSARVVDESRPRPPATVSAEEPGRPFISAANEVE